MLLSIFLFLLEIEIQNSKCREIIKKVPLSKIEKVEEPYLKINSKLTLLHALRTVGDGVANNLNDARHKC